jgi:hypothetical protein
LAAATSDACTQSIQKRPRAEILAGEPVTERFILKRDKNDILYKVYLLGRP